MVAIDHEITDSNSFEDFLYKMRERGIECIYKPENKVTLKFKMQGQQKNIRAGSIGYNYEENAIRRRIEEMVLFRTNTNSFEYKTGLIDTTTERMQETPGLKQWAEIHNLKQLSKSLNLITNNKARNENEGVEIIERLSKLNREISELSGIIRNIETVRKHKPIVAELQQLQQGMFTKKKAQAFETEHQKQIKAYHNANISLRETTNKHYVRNGKLLPVVQLQAQLESLKSDKEILDIRRKNLKKELIEVNKAYAEAQAYLSLNPHLNKSLQEYNSVDDVKNTPQRTSDRQHRDISRDDEINR
jgi:hypothetical protein